MPSATPNNIRKLRDTVGLSQDALAAKIGEDATGATISRLESGRMHLTLDWMVRIAEALEVTPYDLIPAGADPVRFVPVIGQISAGNWREAIAEPIGMVPIPSEAAGPKAFALKPLGDSMNLVVSEEGYAVVDPDQRELIARKVYAFRNEHGETTIKRYAESPPRLEPCSSNDEHKPMLLGAEGLVVIGRVVLAIQPVD
jgi:repressor LexA